MLSGVILIDKMKKLAFFDFCDTLVSFQTADAFVDYVRKMEGNTYMRFLDLVLIVLIKIRIIAAFNKFLPDAALGKKIKLLQLKGFTYEKLNNLAAIYYQEMIRPNLVKPVMAEMQRLAQQDYEICLVSAGYSIYLKYFTEEHQIKHIISTEIAFDQSGNYCHGIILGKDCIRDEKVSRLKTYFAGQKVNYKESISYSDSKTDLPLLLLVGKGVVVSRANSQSWTHQYNFKEIIWDKEQ
jgi:HAD superfamily hydrolase (TIGR01490 family)